MIYLEMFLLSFLLFIVGLYCGVQYSLQVLNKERFTKIADDAVNKAFCTASSIRNLCESYVYAAIKLSYPFPYNDRDVQSHLERKINLN